MIPGHIVAQECIAILTTPLLAAFLDLLRSRDEVWSGALVTRLQALCDGRTPALWAAKLNIAEAQGAYRVLMQGQRIALGDLLRDGTDRSQALPVVTLLIRRDKKPILLPPDDFLLAPGDELLLAGSRTARRNLELTLHNPNELDYVLTGSEISGSWLWQRCIRSARTAGEP